MRQRIETNHTLEIRDRPGFSFRPVTAGMYHEARQLADDGLIERAMQRACDIHIENYGQMHGISFRVVTKTMTVSVIGPWEDCEQCPH